MGLINMDYLQTLFDNDQSIIDEVTEKIVTTLPEQIEQLSSSLGREDLSDSSRLFHAVKSSMKMLGVDKASEIAFAGECAASDQDILTSKDKFQELQEIISQVIEELNDIRDNT